MKNLYIVLLFVLCQHARAQKPPPAVADHLLGEYMRAPNAFSSVAVQYTGPTVHYLTSGSTIQLSSVWTIPPGRPGALSATTRYYKLSRNGTSGSYYAVENNGTTTPLFAVQAGVYTYRITRSFIYNNTTVSGDFDTVFYKDVTIVVKPDANTWAYAGNDTLIYQDMESKYMIGGAWVNTRAQKIILDGRGSTGDTSWAWTKTKAPAGDRSTILESNAALTEVAGISLGEYEFTLTINGAISDRMSVIYRNKKYEYMAAACRTGAPVVHVLPPSKAPTLGTNGQYYASWDYPYVAKHLLSISGQALMGGDHIVLNAERAPGVPIDSVTKVWLDGFGGRKECPVVIRTETKVPIVLKGDGSTIVFGGGDQLNSSCVYFTVDGTYWRSSGTPYSFRFDNRNKMAQTAVPTQVTPLSFDFASAFTFRGFRSIGGGSIKLKMEAQMRPPRQLRFFSYDSIVLSDIWQSRVNNEGYYVLSTASEGTKSVEQYSTPPRGKHIQLKNILIDSTLWDGLQITNCHKDALIENVFSWRTGKEDAYGQNLALNFGGTIQGKVINNVIKDSHGKGLSAQTNALDQTPTEIAGNVIDSVGYNLSTGVFESDGMIATGSHAYPEYIGWGTVNIHDNVITMRSANRSGLSLGYVNGIGLNASSAVNDNIFVHPDAVRLNRYDTGAGPVAVGFNDQVTTPHTGNYGKFNRTFKWAVSGVDETGTGYKIRGSINDLYREWTSIYSMNIELRRAAQGSPNLAPVIMEHPDTVIMLPVDSITLMPIVTDAENDSLLFRWTKTSTLGGTVSSPATAKDLKLTALEQGVHSFEFWVSDGFDSSIRNFVVTVLADTTPVNLPPTADAGTTTTINTATTTLVGTGSDPEEGILAYHWKKVAGPAGALIGDTSARTTTVTKLVTGTYLFALTVTDDKGLQARDSIVIIVVLPPIDSNKYVKVNLFGGVNPYANSEWNNWNVVSSVSTGKLRYSNATSSNITATLSKKQTVADNGATYGGTMAPPEVLRYTSYGTAARTLTISGLTPSKTYNLELYASRANTGNYTTFTVNGKLVTVLTDYNKSVKASFTGLVPSAGGQLVVTIGKVNAQSYLNGFVLTERNGVALQPAEGGGGSKTMEGLGNAPRVQSFRLSTGALDVKAAPNPSGSYFTVAVSGRSGVPVDITIFDALGRVVEQKRNVASPSTVVVGRHLGWGTYYLEGVQAKERQRLKLVKARE